MELKKYGFTIQKNSISSTKDIYPTSTIYHVWSELDSTGVAPNSATIRALQLFLNIPILVEKCSEVHRITWSKNWNYSRCWCKNGTSVTVICLVILFYEYSQTTKNSWFHRYATHVHTLKRINLPLSRRFLLSILLSLVALGVIFLGIIYLVYLRALPSIDKIEGLALPESSVIRDRNGNELYSIFAWADGKRTYVPFLQISQTIRDAVISTEDKTFWKIKEWIFVDWYDRYSTM